MPDLLQRIDAHLIQCHRHDESERLLAEAKAEIARLSASRDRAIEGYQRCVDKYEAVVGKYGALLDGSELASAKAEIARLNHEMEATKEAARAREAILKEWVISFCAPHAGKYAEGFDWPYGHLHPRHYDILEECGARMDDFTRAALNGEGGNG